MCLYSTTQKALIAKEDIYCYKILRIGKYININEFFLYTPIVKKVIPKIPYTMDDKKQQEKLIKLYDRTVEISSGFIHAYLSTAHQLYYDNGIYVECIIPKGTKYYLGNNDDICAKKIKLLRIMQIEEINPVVRYELNYYPSLPLYKYSNETLWSEIKDKIKIKIISFFKWLF